MRSLRSIALVTFIILEILALTGLVIKDGWRDPVSRARLRDNQQLVETCRISDLSLWTEARYTRHPSQADGFTAFQDGPAAPDHFPAGTWIPNPQAGRQKGLDVFHARSP